MTLTVAAQQPAPTLPQIVAFKRGVSLTAAAILASIVAPVEGSYLVGGHCRVISGATFNFVLQVAWTDETGNSGTRVLPWFVGGYGSGTMQNADGTLDYSMFMLTIRVKAGTTITMSTVGTFTSVLYNAESEIIKISD